MNKHVFNKISNRIAEGDPEVYRELLRRYGPSCMKKLASKAGCSAEEAEMIFIEAILHLRDQILQQRVAPIGNLKEYLFLASWEIWRKHRKLQQQQMGEGEEIKQAFFELSQKKYGRQVQLEVVRSPEEHYSRMLALTRSVIERLPEEGQQVLHLYYQQHRSLGQIARMMDLEGGEAEAGQLKSYYYIQWMNELENEVQHYG